jgi:hypothetical protein
MKYASPWWIPVKVVVFLGVVSIVNNYIIGNALYFVANKCFSAPTEAIWYCTTLFSPIAGLVKLGVSIGVAVYVHKYLWGTKTAQPKTV